MRALASYALRRLTVAGAMMLRVSLIAVAIVSIAIVGLVGLGAVVALVLGLGVAGIVFAAFVGSDTLAGWIRRRLAS